MTHMTQRMKSVKQLVLDPHGRAYQIAWPHFPREVPDKKNNGVWIGTRARLFDDTSMPLARAVQGALGLTNQRIWG